MANFVFEVLQRKIFCCASRNSGSRLSSAAMLLLLMSAVSLSSAAQSGNSSLYAAPPSEFELSWQEFLHAEKALQLLLGTVRQNQRNMTETEQELQQV